MRSPAWVVRLPLRVRLVAGFSAAMLVLLTAAGGFVYWRVQFALDRGIDGELSTATGTLSRLVAADGSVTDRDAADATGVAWQVLTLDADVVSRGLETPVRPLVGTGALTQAARDGTTTVDTGRFLPASKEPFRARVSPLPQGDDLLVVAVRRDHRDEALRELLLQLVVAGLGALVVAGLVGERLAHAALSPVERYRRRASDIAAGGSGLRLDVPRDRDDEVTRLGHTLNRMLDTLESALERERRFVNDASHELRTPLTLLTSRIQLARRRTRSVDEHEAVLAELEVDVTRLSALADHLLALSSHQHAGRGGAPTTDLAAMARHAVEHRLLAGADELGEVEVEATSGPAGVPLSGMDAERLLGNLLANALLHGRPPVQVRVRADVDWVVLSVSDAGDGMPPELLAHATGRFARADDARTRPGSGLGLALVDDIVRTAGGELRLCHGGHHHPVETTVDGPCDHDDRMTVTVVLPRVT